MNANLYSKIDFTKHANKALIIDNKNNVLTYQKIDERVAQFCNYLHSLDLKKNDIVIQQTQKSIDGFCVHLACLRSGLIYIPLNPAFTDKEIKYYIEDAKPKLFICNIQKSDNLEALKKESSCNFIIEALADNNSGSLQKQADKQVKYFDCVASDSNDIACILYTSGTTGKPKGAMLSHHNLFHNMSKIAKHWQFSENDILLHALPTFHCHGLFFACQTAMYSGACLVFLNKFDVDNVIKHLPSCTTMMGVPTFYTRLLADDRFTKAVASNMRIFISGSAPLLENTFIDFENKTGHKILERYGMTETGINTSNPVDGPRKVGTVGMPLADSQFRIISKNNNPVKINEPGEIQVKNESVFKGYWNNPEKTKAAFTEDGFFHTGDIATIDEDGYITIVARESDMIISGGLNIYPKEIEIVINNIKGVNESAVIGVPHVNFGEGVVAVVAANNLTEQTITDTVKTTLANYKVPKKVLFVETLPKNAMGKVQKNILKTNYKDVLV